METKSGDLDSVAASTGKGIETEAPPLFKSIDYGPQDEVPAPEKAVAAEEVPDPDEDDLDDLDGSHAFLTIIRYANSSRHAR